MFGIIGCLLGFVIILILSYKNLSVFIGAILSVLAVALFNKMPLVDTLVKVYFPAVGDYFGQYFGIFLFGAILGQLYTNSGASITISRFIFKLFIKENDSIQKKQILSLLVIILAGGILSYGGINCVVAVFTLYPLALSIFNQANIPKKFIVGVMMGGTVTFAMTAPGSPQTPNIVPMNILGTSSIAGLIPGVVATIVEIILMILILNKMINYSKRNGEKFEYGVKDIVFSDNKKRPNLLFSLFPMIVVFILFNIVKLNITISLMLGVLSAIVLFYKFITEISLFETINIGAISSATAMTCTCSVVGFGSVIKMTDGFNTVLEGLLKLSISPILMLIICVALLSALTGGAAAGQQLILPSIAPIFIKLGVSPSIIHRISSFASSTLDTLPYCGALLTTVNYADLTLKESYPSTFITTVFATSCGTIVTTILLILFPNLA